MRFHRREHRGRANCYASVAMALLASTRDCPAQQVAHATASQHDRDMTSVVRGIVWLGIFVGVCVAPLIFALIGATEPGQGFRTDFSVALGFVGLSLMGIEFALVARVKTIALPFGTDGIIDLHRQIGYTGLAFVLVHVALSFNWDDANPFGDNTPPPRVWFGTLALLSLLVLVAISVWRRRLRLRYEVWHVAHTTLAVIAVASAMTHVLLVHHYIGNIWKQVLWSLMATAFVWVLVWARLLRPLLLRRRPWTVAEVRPDRGGATVLTLTPVGHEGLRFEPGQFAWIIVGRSPFALTANPFSLSSSAEQAGSIRFTIKAAGDFTAGVPTIEPGTRVYVDGPHGVFSIDEYEGAGFGFITGGVGIGPALGMLETLADRGDVRPVVLFSGNRDWDSVIARERLAELAETLNLTVVHLLQDPPPGWTGETGYLDAAILDRHLPTGLRRRFQYFACGPAPMIAAAEKALVGLGVPADRFHTERFDWV